MQNPAVRIGPLCMISIVFLLRPQPCLALPNQPADLQPGDVYHWMFVTSGQRDASSTNIDIYNNFVTSQAVLNPALTGTNEGVLWYAIASTAAIAARDNALISGPVYLLNGVKFADSFAEMWNGFPKAVKPNIDQFGLPLDPSDGDWWAWTDTDFDGSIFGGGLGSPGGDQWAGNWNTNLASWTHFVHLGGNSDHRFYALSSPLKALAVPPVPEPTAAFLFTIGVALAARRRRGREGRRHKTT